MFHMARENLEESLRIRSNNPFAHYYYGVVLPFNRAHSGRKTASAQNEFALAVQYDQQISRRNHTLHRALSMIDSKDTHTREIVENLKEYVVLYQRQNADTLPSGSGSDIRLSTRNTGETSWTATPAMNVSTKTSIRSVSRRRLSGQP